MENLYFDCGTFIKVLFKIGKERNFSLRWISDSLGINRYSVKKLIRSDIRNEKVRERLRAIIKKAIENLNSSARPNRIQL